MQATRAGEHLLGSVEDQAPVRQTRERIVERAVFKLVALLLDQAPGALARTRERSIEQEYEGGDEQPEDQRDEAPCSSAATRMVGGLPLLASQPAFAEPRGAGRRQPGRASPPSRSPR